MKKVVLKTSKKWILVECDPEMTIKDIIERLDGADKTYTPLPMLGYRIMNGPDNERKWRWPNGNFMGNKAHGLVRHIEKIVEAQGIATLIDSHFTMWKDRAAGKVFKTGMTERVKPGTVKKLDALVEKKHITAGGTMTISFTGSPDQIDQMVKQYVAGRK